MLSQLVNPRYVVPGNLLRFTTNGSLDWNPTGPLNPLNGSPLCGFSPHSPNVLSEQNSYTLPTAGPVPVLRSAYVSHLPHFHPASIQS